MGIFKNMSELISEAAEVDDFNTDDITDDEALEAIDDLCDDFDDMEEVDPDDVEYTEEMVCIIGQKGLHGTRYLMEHDSLAKYMATRDLSIKEAMEAVCEANNIGMADTYLLIESKEEMVESIEEAKAALKGARKSSTKASLKLKFKNTANAFETLSNAGVKIIARKSKKKKK
jgi:hypothetical protein